MYKAITTTKFVDCSIPRFFVKNENLSPRWYKAKCYPLERKICIVHNKESNIDIAALSSNNCVCFSDLERQFTTMNCK